MRDGITLQLLDLDSVPASAERFDSLSSDESDRANRFVTDRLATHYRLAHAFVRDALAAHTGLRAEAIRYETNAWGKPDLPARECRFNLSHSDHLALLGISADTPLGVDIEKLKIFEADELRSLARTIMTPAEQASLNQLLDTSGTQAARVGSTAFLTAWTRKEACVKALGFGLSFGVETLQVGLDHNRQIIDIRADDASKRPASRLVLESIAIENRAICALASVDT